MIINSKIKLALHHLRTGVIAHPTDTIYGLGCLANNPSAIQTIINLKKRDIKNPAFKIAKRPKHGVLTGQAPNLIYTPKANYHGKDFL